MTDNKLLANYNYSFYQQYNPLIAKTKGQKINTIGIVACNLESYFTSAVLKGIAQVAGDAGFELIITNSQANQEREIANARLLLEKRVNGVIALPCSTTSKLPHLNAFKNLGIPIIVFDRVQQHGQTETILIDYRGCGYMAAGHLISQGCKHISMVTGSFNADNNLQYYNGYKDALQKHSIQLNPAILMQESNHDDAGRSAADCILQMNPRPDGLFFTNDIEAASCMQALKEAGVSIPNDIAIVAAGNTPVSRLVSPALTAIDYPGYETGKAIASALFSRLNSKRLFKQHKITVMAGKLIVRNSSVKMTQVNA